NLHSNTFNAIAIGPGGDVFAVGLIENVGTGGDFLVVKVAGREGTQRWRRVIDGPNQGNRRLSGDDARAVAVDARGNPIVTGLLGLSLHCESRGPGSPGLVKFSGRTGRSLWRRPYCLGDPLLFSGVAIDPAGNPVTGPLGYPANTSVTKLRGDNGREF